MPGATDLHAATANQLSEQAWSRVKLYQLLATVYIKPPDPDFLKLLAGWVSSLIKNKDYFKLLPEQMKRSLSLLDGFFQKAGGESWEEFEATMSVEFTRLFRGVKPFYSPLPPYESVYRAESKRIFSESTIEVQQEYRHFGVGLAKEVNGEPPDHISFELEFMGYLCSQEAAAWARNDESSALGFLEAEKEFLRKHLMIWLPRWCEEVGKYDRQGIFSGFATLTEGWIIFDCEWILQNIEQDSF